MSVIACMDIKIAHQDVMINMLLEFLHVVSDDTKSPEMWRRIDKQLDLIEAANGFIRGALMNE